MNEVKWIKITTDIFDDEKILLLEDLPDGDAIIVVWFKLLCLAGKMNNSGVFVMNDKIPYTDTMLATIFRRKEKLVRLALQAFEQFGMIEIVDGVITIPNWGKHQNLDKIEQKREYMKEYMKGYRDRQNKLACKTNCKTNSKTPRKVNGKSNVSRIEKEIDIDLSLTGERSAPAHAREEEPQAFGTYKNVFLTASEIEQLQNELPDRWEEIAQRVSTYKKQTGKSYASDFATIRRWAEEDADCISETIDQLRPKRGSGGGKSNAFSTYDGQREYTPEEYDELELAMRKRRAGAESEGEE